LKILVSAYCCLPNGSSEQGFGWWWITEAAKIHDVTVVTCAAQKNKIEVYLKTNPIKIKIEYVKGPSKVSASGTAYKFERFHQYLWQLKAIKKVRHLTKKQNFDIAQHVTVGSWRQPSCLAFSSVKYVFGPTSGSERLPPGFYWKLGVRGFFWEKLREFFIWISRFDPLIRLNLRRASAIITTGPATYAFMRERYPKKTFSSTRAFPNNNIKNLPKINRKNPSKDQVVLSWMGRLIPRKGLELLLYALTDDRLKNLSLMIIGYGPCLQRYLRLVNKLMLLSKVRFLGHLPQKEALRYLARSDIFVFTSLQDMMGQSLSEAMQIGLPCIVFDWSGPSHLVGDKGAYKVPVTSYKNTCRALADALFLLKDNRNLRFDLSRAAVERIQYLINPNRISKERDNIYNFVLNPTGD